MLYRPWWDGLAVAVNDRGGGAQLHEVARGIGDDGGTAGAFAADVTDEHEVAGLVAAISASLGAVEVLVLNAAGPQPEAPVAEVAWQDHLDQLGFFVKSPVLLGRAVLPGMRARRSGRIIHGRPYQPFCERHEQPCPRTGAAPD